MKKLKQLLEERAAKVTEAQALVTAAEAERRELKPEEETQFDNLMAEARALDPKIDRAREIERLEGEEAVRSGQRLTNNHNTQEGRDLSKYSMTAVFKAAAEGRQLTGLEAEMAQEAKKEAREAGVQILGYGIPRMVLEHRDNSITNPTQPEDGSILVSKEVRSLMDVLRERLVFRQLGATVLPNMTGDVAFPRMTQGATSTWKGETETLDKSNIKFDGMELSPKRLGTYITVSKQFLLQTPASTEPMLRNDIIDSAQVALDKAFINGDGTKKPLGILNTPGIGAVVLGTNGAALTRSNILALMAALDLQNAAQGSLGFLMHTLTQYKLMDTKLDTGSGRFVMEEVARLLGYKVGVTNLVPANITKGTGTNLSALVFGNFADYVIAQWGGFDVTIDNITGAKNGEINYILNSFWDGGVRRPQSFAAIKDVSNA